jgi:hypothetical protein
MGETMKFFVDERYQYVSSSFISVAPGNQQLGHIMMEGSHPEDHSQAWETAESAADYTPSREDKGRRRPQR